MAEPKKIEDVILQLRQDTIENWEKNQTKLKKGEPGLIYSNSGSNPLGLVFGNGDREEDLPLISIYSNGQCFYPGKGAGYELPKASEAILGGIKINTSYFEMSGEQLQPLTMVYTNLPTQHTPGNYALTLPETTDLNIDGDLYFKKAYGDYLWVKHLDQEYETITETANQYSNIHYSNNGDVIVNVLENGEREGLLLHNYRTDEKDTIPEYRTIAELSINNNGILLYSPDNKNVEFQHILTMSPLTTGVLEEGFLFVTKSENGGTVVTPKQYIESEHLSNLSELTITVNGVDHIYSPNINDASYTNKVELTIPTSYCSTLIFDGQTYIPDENNVISLSASNFNEEYRQLVDKSVTQINFLGEAYTANNHVLELHDNRSWVGDNTSIEVNTVAGQSTISHKAPVGFVQDEDLDGSLEVNIMTEPDKLVFISGVTRDSKGHVIKYERTTVNISDLLLKIKELEDRILILENN